MFLGEAHILSSLFYIYIYIYNIDTHMLGTLASRMLEALHCGAAKLQMPGRPCRRIAWKPRSEVRRVCRIGELWVWELLVLPTVDGQILHHFETMGNHFFSWYLQGNHHLFRVSSVVQRMSSIHSMTPACGQRPNAPSSQWESVSVSSRQDCEQGRRQGGEAWTLIDASEVLSTPLPTHPSFCCCLCSSS